ncbi:conjugal transfer protein TraH [Orientia tsutsugamushi]|uniref:conjugal transfer protein TraH n=1 Tax=Orientia tsutsugamushi TaxID=784 RepID=UPI00339D9BFD
MLLDLDHIRSSGWILCSWRIICRTSQTSFQPFAITPPSLNMSCSGIDAYLGSFSVISGEELVQLMKNIGSQAKVYAFSLGLKTFAPQIENALKDLRNLAMEMNQFAKEIAN